MGLRTPERGSSCWVIYLDRPDGRGHASAALVPLVVGSTESKALELLEELLSFAPGRDNLVEDHLFRAGAQSGETVGPDAVHVVITTDEDGPVVSEVFASIDDANGHADQLRRSGEEGVVVTAM